MGIPRLTLGQLNRPGQALSVYRVFYPPGRTYPTHTHDFAEVFLLESGTGTQHREGHDDPLEVGSVWFVDPDLPHALSADRGQSMILTNLAFDRSYLDLLRPLAGPVWPWRAAAAQGYRLVPQDLADVVARISRLDRLDTTPLETVAFLGDLLTRLPGNRPDPAAGLPPWLAEVLDPQDPDLLRGGVAHLAARTGRTAGQIARLVRAATGHPTIALINRLRMDWLARALRSSDSPLEDLADQCGLPNRSHLNRVFQAHHGTTPFRYRQRYQAPP